MKLPGYIKPSVGMAKMHRQESMHASAEIPQALAMMPTTEYHIQ